MMFFTKNHISISARTEGQGRVEEGKKGKKKGDRGGNREVLRNGTFDHV